MIKKYSYFIFLFLIFCACCQAAPSKKTPPKRLSKAEIILKKVDANRLYGSASMNGVMRIKGRVLRVKRLRMWQRGEDDALAVFTNSEDEGTKFLKLRNQMWIYYPEVEEVIKISGHLLREGMMGSDFSYEDAMDNKQLLDDYAVTLTGNEIIASRSCYVLELKAKRRGVSYPKRMVWVDKKQYVIRKMDLYSLSGRLLKVMSMGKVRKIKGKYIATWMRMENRLRKKSYTEFEIRNLRLDVKLPKRMFSKEYLFE